MAFLTFCVLVARSQSSTARAATDVLGREVGREVKKVGHEFGLIN
jgi:hypothetical protein